MTLPDFLAGTPGAGWGEGLGGEHLVLAFHPLANLFPLIEGAAFDELVADVVAQGGILETIVIHEGKILDGRNRYRACEAARIPVTADECVAFSEAECGTALEFVLSRNLHRRHLSESQRAMVAAKIATMRQGERTDLAQANPTRHLPAPVVGDDRSGATAGETAQPSANLQKVSQADAAALLHVSERSVASAKKVVDQGAPELAEAVTRGEVSVSAAADITKLSPDEQRELISRADPKVVQEVAKSIRGGDINGARAIMASRQEPDGSLDYFPTPPWATRALVDRVFPHLGIVAGRIGSVWEPACGEGHIAEVLREYCPLVMASDIHDYGYGEETLDFLAADSNTMADWIVTNPPFEDRAIQFVDHALHLSRIGVAMFFRSQWAVEGVERYEAIFRKRPPTLCAFFVERVNLCKGRWDPDGSTATAYCWLVWLHRDQPRPPFWIPPGCRKDLTRETDRERFTVHPVMRIFKGREGTPSALPTLRTAAAASLSSWPGLSRPSTSPSETQEQGVDARDEPGHDGEGEAGGEALNDGIKPVDAGPDLPAVLVRRGEAA